MMDDRRLERRARQDDPAARARAGVAADGGVAPRPIKARVAALVADPLVRALLDAAGVSVIVSNRERQILAGDSALLTSLTTQGIAMIEGLRPGDALRCRHAREAADGCGTSAECSACGTALAMIESQRTNATVERECLMSVDGDASALELRVRASQIEIAGERLTIVGLRDVSAEKRRDALERTFLHDISNTVSPLLVNADLLLSSSDARQRPLAERVARLAHRLRRDLEDQRVLLAAERGTLKVRRTPVVPQAALTAARAVFDGSREALGRSLETECGGPLPAVATDESLLVRVLVNMMKNALEATPEGGVVRAWAERARQGCEFRVWNAGVIAPSLALQVFKRSFTTKGETGRGLGTFSMKLLGERYLGGTVAFTSTERDGTTFFIRLPS